MMFVTGKNDLSRSSLHQDLHLSSYMIQIVYILTDPSQAERLAFAQSIS